MLTTSPRIPASASASPSTFHYAPTRSSPQSSPSRISAPLTRRLSRSSTETSSAQMTSPSLQQQQQQTQTQTQQPQQSAPGPSEHQDRPRPRHYVSVDAGTQYSPMEMTSTSEAATDAAEKRLDDASANTSSEDLTVPSQPSATSRMAVPPAPSEPAVQQPPQPSVVAPTSRLDGATSVLSPGKRRKSQASKDLARVTAALETDEAESSSAPKRQRQAPAPVKVLPQKYELCSWEDIVVLVAHMLAELIETNDALALQSGNLTRFHSRTAPSISVLEYLNRLAKHATLTPPLLLSMVYYIDRLCALYPEFTINTLTVHRFLITAATVAAKGLSDSFWNNTTYARVGGVRVAELKLLELEFLYRVDWKIVPNPEVLVAYYRGLVERCPGYVLQGDEAVESQDEDAGDSTDVSDEDSADSPGEGTPATGSSGRGEGT